MVIQLSEQNSCIETSDKTHITKYKFKAKFF